MLATGRKSDTYGGLGGDRSILLSTRAVSSRLESYQSSSKDVAFRLELVQMSLGRLQDMSSDAKSQIRGSAFELNSDGQSSSQIFARASLSEALSVLNTEVAGRSLFAGRAVEGDAVITPEMLLDGDGAGKVGYKQVMLERAQADMGADNRGRMVISAPALDTVNLAEDGAHPFGFKLSEVTTTSANITLSTSFVAPSQTDIQFAGQPSTGENVRLSFQLPDGTVQSIELKASTTGLESNSFAIGADANATAANFQAALETALEYTAQTGLNAASAMQAANDFYDNPPRRVDNTATPSASTGYATTDTTLTTVSWYSGEDDPSVSDKDTAQAFIGRNRKVSYGMRANEAPFQAILKSLTVMSAATFSDTQSDNKRYEELTNRASNTLSFSNGQTSINSKIAEVASLQSYVGQSQTFNEAEINLATALIADRETADINEVAVRLSSIQVHLQAAYSATSIVSKLSLTNYL
jgi:hypothetical protein